MEKQLPRIISEYIEVSNAFDENGYASCFIDNGVIDELSVGRKFEGEEEIKQYFRDYFIDCKTSTKIQEYQIEDNVVTVKVIFKGVFPNGNQGISGFYEFSLSPTGKIEQLIADLK
ncbi:MAG: hypothetical protein ABS911_09780 [Carnobacterium sp.]|uniref:hypothetical protein n=1 Tax=Carnobacterium sp. TaxID=48221 RepID=UPI003316258B